MPRSVDLGPWPHLAYVGASFDRAAERRNDADFLRRAAEDAATRAVLISGELIVTRQNAEDPLWGMQEARALGAAGSGIFLGLESGATRFGFSFPAETAERLKECAEYAVNDLRSIALKGLVDPRYLQLIATAKALIAWHERRPFCSNCGSRTNAVEAGWRRDCPSCNAQHFPRTDPCVIMLAIDGERCLLGRAPRFPPEMWSCLAGFVEPGETIEEAVRRETLEEVGITAGRVTYFISQPWPFPMSLMIGCHAEAKSTEIKIDPNEIADARWVPREEAALMLARKHPAGLFTPPPFAVAHHLLRAYVERGADVLDEVARADGR